MSLLLQIFKWCLGYYMWQDNKYIIVLSTLRTDVYFEKARNRKRKYGREEEVIKPKLIFQIIIRACLALIERIEGCQAFRRLSVRRLQENVFSLIDLAILPKNCSTYRLSKKGTLQTLK